MSTKKYKKLLSLGLAFCFMVLSISNGVIVRAAEKITVNNECVLLPEKQVSEICEAVVENITEKYAGVYSFENIDVTIYNEQEEVENIVVDVEVLTDMILIRNPQDSPYVQGMKAEIQTMTDTEEKAAAVFAMNSYLQNANKYYNVPILTGFCYRIYVPKVTTMSDFASAEYNIYHRVDTEDGAILTEVQENERITEIKDVEDGKQYINNALAETEAAALRAVSYNESDAVDYAVAHAKDIPEYSAANGNGSDCANFVSKCVNAGGIPQDKNGGYSAGWYQGSLNWIRTGYNGETGVVLYLKDKGYFDSVSSSKSATEGSIMSYNTKSHVAMVTLIDGSTIKYSHHSNVQKTSVYYVYDSGSDNVTFYVPQV